MIGSPITRFVFFPIQHPEGDWHLQERVRAEDVWLTTADGVRIHGWWFATDAADCATLFLHGNAGNVTHRIDHAQAVLEAGSSALVLDYRGYGKSGGLPTERGLYRDADAGYDWLIAAGFSSDKVIIHGESLGAAVATELAARRTSAALVLESPFSSLADMANRLVPFLGTALIRGFDTRAKIERVRCPLLIIHGDTDQIIPISQARAVFAAANEPKTFWPVHRAGHNDLLYHAGEDYVAHLKCLYNSFRSNAR
jgi:fermentation-respiration switch protein FrsA (DUF1100 family)